MNKILNSEQNKTGDNIMEKQQINCTVHDCKHCNYEKDQCKLEQIKVCNCMNEKEKEATMCDNYKKREL